MGCDRFWIFLDVSWALSDAFLPFSNKKLPKIVFWGNMTFEITVKNNLMSKSFETTWENCLSVIKDNVSIQAFKTWFEPI